MKYITFIVFVISVLTVSSGMEMKEFHLSATGHTGNVDNTKYLYRSKDITVANIALGIPVKVCSPDLPTVTQAAIDLWNDALKDTGAVNHNVFDFQEDMSRYLPYTECDISSNIGISGVKVYHLESTPTSETKALECSSNMSLGCMKFESKTLSTYGSGKETYTGSARATLQGRNNLSIRWNKGTDKIGHPEYPHMLKTLIHELGHLMAMAHYYCPGRTLEAGLEHAQDDSGTCSLQPWHQVQDSKAPALPPMKVVCRVSSPKMLMISRSCMSACLAFLMRPVNSLLQHRLEGPCTSH